MQQLHPALSSAKNVITPFGLPYFDLDEYDLNCCPIEFLQLEIVHQGIGLILLSDDLNITVATIDPTAPLLQELGFITGKQPHFVVTDADKLSVLIQKLNQQPRQHLIENYSEAYAENNPSTEIDDEAPVVRFIDQILADALQKSASDIHFEPYEQHYRIRFRIDGLLMDAASPPKPVAQHLTTRLKIMANLDISERRLPQDGQLQFSLAPGKIINCRVNSCPTLYGEKIVLRILKSHQRLNIDQLGLSTTQENVYLQALQQSQGLILVTGPTGSGKTLTLYTGLSQLNTVDKNISTVEDPIEIQCTGINQISVNYKTGLSFACVLRALLRQDPDIIMVGEIRDLETAEIAINAAQTGHLVLSTVHTNSACETLIRFANMGVPAYNIVSAISLIIAQRLVRKLCAHCKIPEIIPANILIQQGFHKEEITQLRLYAANPKGCNHCHKGYCGRTGIYELLPMSAAMRELILAQSDIATLLTQAQQEGFISIRASGLKKAREGETSLKELNRVA